MYNKINVIIKKNKDLIKDNITLFVSFLCANILSYFFQFYVGRTLGPSDYGVFGSLLSIIYIIAMPLVSIQTISARFVSKYKVEKDYGKLAYFLSGSFKKLLMYGIIIVFLLISLSPFISGFLRIESATPLVILSFFTLFALLLPIGRGTLQGLQRFKEFGWSLLSEGITKVVFGVLLISFFGIGINGAVSAFVLSYFVPLLLILYLLRNLLKREKKKFDTTEVYKYAYPMLIMLLSLTFFYSIDVILVKHFFDSENAGFYAALSLLGKVIFFGSISVSTVMFPKVSELVEKNMGSKDMLYKSLLIILLIGGGVTGFYFLFPEFSMEVLFGSDYLKVSRLVGWFGLFMTLFSSVYLISLYIISLNKKRFILLLLIFNIIEAVAIWYYHISLFQIILMLINIMFILFLILFFYVRKLDDGKIINNYPSI